MGEPQLANTASPEAYQLSTLLNSVKKTLNEAYGGYYWVVGEVAEISYSRQGHCYMTLCEMVEGKVQARVQANIWTYHAKQLLGEFERVTGSKVERGMQLMLQVKLECSPLYGLSLTVLGINAEHTLGALEVAKRKTIQQLERDGVLKMNATLILPTLLLRIAVITSPTAAGWGDFTRQIEESDVARLFGIELYPATMQGAETRGSVIAALDKILGSGKRYDVILLLRGGGSRMDLSAFDDYELCAVLAQAPIPILTGIGHERDESVADLVAHTHLKTPTALAEFIIRKAQQEVERLLVATTTIEEVLSGIKEHINQRYTQAITQLRLTLSSATKNESHRLSDYKSRLSNAIHQEKMRAGNKIERYTMLISQRLYTLTQESRLPLERQSDRIRRLLTEILPHEENRLSQAEKLMRSYDPRNIMKRGFLPVLQGEKSVTSISDITPDTPLRVLLQDGEVEATIQNTIPNE